jgi:hypothetical protein
MFANHWSGSFCLLKALALMGQCCWGCCNGLTCKPPRTWLREGLIVGLCVLQLCRSTSDVTPPADHDGHWLLCTTRAQVPVIPSYYAAARSMLMFSNGYVLLLACYSPACVISGTPITCHLAPSCHVSTVLLHPMPYNTHLCNQLYMPCWCLAGWAVPRNRT